MPLTRLTLCADMINKKHTSYKLLDVGCRTMDLKPLLNDCREYSGTDLLPPVEGVFQCDLEKKLPFKDRQFDVVTALDILEHLDNPHDALQELYRVAKKTVYIALPNMYYISFRKRFLFGGGISGKYTFHSYAVKDRHRWILSYDEAIAFIKKNSIQHQIRKKNILPVRGKTKWIMTPLEKLLAKLWPNAFVYGVLFEVTIDE